jgi:hypothetical protein
MMAVQWLLASRSGVQWLKFAATLIIVTLCSGARADTIRLTYDDTQADPAETFDEDCLGDAPAEDCDTRAALIEGELATLLSQLESDEDPETLALFQASLELQSPVVQAMAVRYLSRAEQEPDDFFSSVKTFFLGPDAPLGVSSSAVLQTSAEVSDQELAQLFDEQRPAAAYAPQDVVDDPSEERLLAACIQDARLNMMEFFSEEEQFAPADRLLTYDRFVRATFNATEDYPVTAFVTDAGVDEVSEFFSKLFGEPHGPVAGSQQRLTELTMQLVELQGQAAGGDQDAIKELQALVEELTQVQQAASLDTYLQLSTMHAENDLVWLDGGIDEVATQVMRAVTVGEEPLLGKTVIRYINAPGSTLGGSNGEGGNNGEGDGVAGASSEPGDTPSDGGAASEGNPGSKSDGGCGCSLPGAPRHASSLAAFSLLVWLLRRTARGSRRSA